MFLDFMLVRARMHVEPLSPRLGHQFYEVVIARGVLSQHNEVSTNVALIHMSVKVLLRHVHLTSEYRLERMLLCICQGGFGLGQGLFVAAFACGGECSLGLVKHLTILLIDIIEEFLDAIHIAVVSESDAGHSVIHGLVDKRRYRCLPIK